MSFVSRALSCAIQCLTFVIALNCFATDYQNINLSEEGWRWKRTFKVNVKGKIHDLEQIDESLQKGRTDLQNNINDFAENFITYKLSFQALLESSPEARRIFNLLNHNSVSVEQILKKLNLNLEAPGSITQIINTDPITKIINENGKRLAKRNYILAGLNYFLNDKLYHQEVVDPESGRIAVFVSGSGNEFLKILENLEPFNSYQFIIFDKDYEGFLKGNLGYILSHQSDRIPLHLKKRSETFQRDVNSYISASKGLDKRLTDYNNSMQVIKNQIQDLPELTSLETTKDHHLAFQSLFNDLGSRFQQLNMLQTSFQEVQLLISEYYHSEQLLRLFLYNHMEKLVKQTDKDSCVILHINSTNDICERCTHCLFLESEMSQADTEQIRPKVGDRKKSRIDPFGFFEKFNNIKGKKDNNNYLIIASSETVGEKRGERHRYLAGHDGQQDSVIDPIQFLPLMAFKTFQNKTRMLPLNSTLMLEPQETTPNTLYQDIFPSVFDH